LLKGGTLGGVFRTGVKKKNDFILFEKLKVKVVPVLGGIVLEIVF
jgi:hypothetical protein